MAQRDAWRGEPGGEPGGGAVGGAVVRLARRGPRRGIGILRRIRAHGGRREARRGAYHGALPCLDPRMRRGGVGFETFVFEDAGAHAGGRRGGFLPGL